MVNCSSVTGIEAFLGEVAEYYHVDYFQGLEYFREQGLRYKLPAAKRDELENDPEFHELQEQVRALTQKRDSRSSINEARSRLSAYRRTFKHETLRWYQK